MKTGTRQLASLRATASLHTQPVLSARVRYVAQPDGSQRTVQYSVIYTFFREYTVQFNTDDFWNKSKGKRRREFRRSFFRCFSSFEINDTSNTE